MRKYLYLFRAAILASATMVVATPRCHLLLGQLPRKSPSTPAAWLQLRNGNDNAGVVAGSLAVAWTFRAPHAIRGLSVANGTVLVGTESGDAKGPRFGPDQSGVVAALDASTGHMLWTRQVPSWVHGDPAMYGGMGLVTFGQFVAKPGGLAAMIARTGEAVWSFVADGGFMTAPAVDTTTHTVNIAGKDGILYTLDLGTGKVVHKVGLRALDDMSSPRIDERGDVYLAASRSVIRYSVPTGKLVWKFQSPELREFGDVPVALTDSLVYATGTRPLTLWRAFVELPFGQFVRQSREGYQLLGRRLSTRDLWFQQQWAVALDRSDGHLVWQRSLGIGVIALRNHSGTPVVAQHRILVSSPVSHTLWGLDPASGRALWSRQLVADHRGAVTVVGDEAFFGDKSGQLTWVAVNDGRLTGRCQAGGAFSALAPVVVGQTLFTATQDGWLRAAPYAEVRRTATASGTASCFGAAN